MNEIEDSYRRFLPVVPTLEVPSITPVVPKVSLILDEPIASRQRTSSSYIPKGPGPEFQNFETWRPTMPPLFNASTEINRSSTPPLQSSSSFSDFSALKLELMSLAKREASDLRLELVNLIKRENAELMSEIRQELRSVIQQKISRVPTSCTGTQTVDASKPATHCKATNTQSAKYYSQAVQTVIKLSEQAIQTECKNMSPNMSSDSGSDVENELDFPNGGASFRRAAVEQIDMMIKRAEEPKEHAFVRNTRRIQELQRPIPRNVGQYYMPLEGPRPSEVSLEAEALLKKYLPPEKLNESRPRHRPPEITPGKRFAVMNMTNVSFAMGYEPDRNLTLRTDNCGYPRGPPMAVPSPPQYRHKEERGYRDFRDCTDFAPIPNYNDNYRDFDPVNRKHRNGQIRDLDRGYGNGQIRDADGNGLGRDVNRGYGNDQIRDTDRGYGNGLARDMDRGYGNGQIRDADGGYGNGLARNMDRGYGNGQIRDADGRYCNGHDREYGRSSPPERDHASQDSDWDFERPNNRVLDLTAIRRQPKLL